jgi:hypothetical protein
VIQLAHRREVFGLMSRTWSTAHEFITVFQPYVAMVSLWTRITPAAPRRAASSSLYVQRP